MLVSLLGAECTGKSTLCTALGQALGVPTVDEYLRHWCLDAGRTPTAAEQAGIAAEQQRRIAAALATAPLVIADTTALMTAVYSQHYFGDDSLLPTALAAQRGCALTLVCSPDGIPWEAAGLLRDGETARQAVHHRLLDLLEQEGLSYRLLGGNLQNRVASARALIAPLGPSSWIAP